MNSALHAPDEGKVEERVNVVYVIVIIIALNKGEMFKIRKNLERRRQRGLKRECNEEEDEDLERIKFRIVIG